MDPWGMKGLGLRGIVFRDKGASVHVDPRPSRTKLTTQSGPLTISDILQQAHPMGPCFYMVYTWALK